MSASSYAKYFIYYILEFWTLYNEDPGVCFVPPKNSDILFVYEADKLIGLKLQILFFW